MNHLIIGYGYCGYYLAKTLLEQKQQIWTISRHLSPMMKLEKATHIETDINAGIEIDEVIDVIHYLIPPPREGREDLILRWWLETNKIRPRKIIYYGSSGIYGNQHGQVTDEDTPFQLIYDRQYRRLDAEEQLLNYGVKHDIIICLFRIAGIIGPHRLPDKNIMKGESVLKISDAPWSNSIYVYDLVNIAVAVSKKIRSTKVFNISDGIPCPMGSTHRLLAVLMGVNAVYEASIEDLLQTASPMKREFLISSKKLSIEKLKKFLGKDLKFTEKVAALKASLAETNV